MTVPTPPTLVGYSPIAHIGSGGYADVFLYEQSMPNRRVAVKVLKPEALAGETQRRQFADEANLMARVSTHPYIVSIFVADISPDGRPFLVMEYYPGDNFLLRSRRERFSVAEVLRIGVQIGSAIETAHRAGILHRDVKPANILTSEFRRPGLTDFGIASSAGHDADDAGGVSIPWSPPEAFGDGELGVSADVYALGATLYQLLAGRSPYEIPGGDNSALALIARIERGALPQIGRTDVPASLERVLAQAMSSRPEQRPASVVDLLRQLQVVESELRLAVTPLELAEDPAPVRERVDDDDDATRVKGVTRIDAQAAVISAVPSSPTGVSPTPPRPREGMLAEPEVVDTVHRPRVEPEQVDARHAAVGRRRWVIPVAVAAAALLLVGVLVVGVGGDGSTASDVTQMANDNLDLDDSPVAPVAVSPFSGRVGDDGTYSFEWTTPPGGPWAFLITEVRDGARPVESTSPTYRGAASCIDVETVGPLPSRQISPVTRGCAR